MTPRPLGLTDPPSASVARRVGAALVCSLALSTTLPPAPARAADPPTCEGRSATAVVTAQQRVYAGTPGDDVVVIRASTVDGAYDVSTGAGADLVCVSYESAQMVYGDLDLGSGDDRVIVTGTADYTSFFTSLGTGADTYLGGAGFDAVSGDGLGADRIDTAGSDDVVFLRAYGRSPFSASVTTGPGGDSVSLTFRGGPQGAVDLGTGQDALRLERAPTVAEGRRGVLDLRAGEYRVDGERALALASAEMVADDRSLARRLSVVGTPDDDSVSTSAPVVRADLGGGNDVLSTPWGGRASWRGGAGRDKITLGATFRRPSPPRDVVLGPGTARTGAVGTLGADSPRWTRHVLAGFEVRRLNAGSGSFAGTGSPGAERLILQGCSVQVRLGAGDDEARHRLPTAPGDLSSCASISATWWGGGGDDLLRGSSAPDRLVGGPGRDRARGGPGADRCRAEIEDGCED